MCIFFIDNSGMRGQEFASLVFFIMGCDTIDTVYFCLFDHHSLPRHAHDPVIAYLVFVCLGVGGESVAAFA